ncbi:MAG: 4Fe-4S dicluster domain-containing protein [Ruminococcaceae bacterium]|nr:4Fe-4S dicluster domain-containing protein [Oscillospiraceae bacterium]
MKILENMDLCYGCGACANACRLDAITMEKASDGFLYPVVDETKCVHCNACKNVCPALQAKFDNDKKPEVFAVMADDSIREKSASGGMFTLLADYALEKNAYICGSAFNDDFRGAHHIMINNRDDLDKLRRSKYMQSENADIYVSIKEKLDAGEFVMFTGTPCQCAAVKTFLKKPYENLLLVDLICHGTPSALAWNKFLEETAPNKEIKDVNFRYKGLKGWSVTTHIEFEDGTEYTKHSKEDLFEQAATKNFISRKSCGSCQFARVPRQADLTIGDFWDIHKYKKSLDDRKGTSAVIINNEKGKRFFEEVLKRNNGILKQEAVPFYSAFARRNSNVYRFPPAHPGRDTFFKSLAAGKKFSAALTDAKKIRYDIMLFGIWYGGNYGSVLTNFALYKFLEDEGYNCIFADIPDHLWSDSIYNRDPLSMPRQFCMKHFNLSFKYKNRTDLKKVNELADAFIVGSDQLWNYPLCRSADTLFYLDFVDDDKKKIAYGTSFGHNEIKGTAEEKRFSGFYLNRFDAVSVREDYAVDLCKKGFGVNAVQVLDPVFMCDKSHYEKCIAEAEIVDPPQDKFVLAYILDPTPAKIKAAEDTAKRMNMELICVANARMKGNMEANWTIPKLDDLPIETWLWYFKNAEMVFTDSFHGTCFSIIFEKPFISIANKGRGSDRFYSLTEIFGLANRVFNAPADIEGKDYLFTDAIDYNDVNDRIAKERARSLKWVKDALDAPKHPMAFSAYDVTDRHIDSTVKQFNQKIEGLQKQLDALTKSYTGISTAPNQFMSEIDLLKKKIEEQNSAQQLLNIELIQQLEMQSNKFEKTVEHYKKRISDMENSFSWKITKPLRWLKKLFKRKK